MKTSSKFLTAKNFRTKTLEDQIIALFTEENWNPVSSVVLARFEAHFGILDRNLAIWGLDGVTDGKKPNDKAAAWNMAMFDVGFVKGNPFKKVKPFPSFARFAGAREAGIRLFRMAKEKRIMKRRGAN